MKDCTSLQPNEVRRGGGASLAGDGLPGDDRAKEKFYTRLQNVVPHLRVFARSIAPGVELADQIVAETLNKCMNCSNNLLSFSELMVIMFYTMRNQAAFTLVSGTSEADASEVTPPAVGMATTSLLGRVEVAMASLPVMFRESLMLLDFHHFTPAEAATVCRTSADVVVSRAGEARRRMKQALQSEFEDVAVGALPDHANFSYI